MHNGSYDPSDSTPFTRSSDYTIVIPPALYGKPKLQIKANNSSTKSENPENRREAR